jgi:hypothetical protein
LTQKLTPVGDLVAVRVTREIERRRPAVSRFGGPDKLLISWRSVSWSYDLETFFVEALALLIEA